MSTTTFNPPKELPTGRRVYPALVIPFGEAVDDAHDDARRVYSWGDAPRLQRRDTIPVDVDHDGQEVGFATSFTKTRQALWCVVGVGDTGEGLIRGRVLNVIDDPSRFLLARDAERVFRDTQPSTAS